MRSVDESMDLLGGLHATAGLHPAADVNAKGGSRRNEPADVVWLEATGDDDAEGQPSRERSALSIGTHALPADRGSLQDHSRARMALRKFGQLVEHAGVIVEDGQQAHPSGQHQSSARLDLHEIRAKVCTDRIDLRLAGAREHRHSQDRRREVRSEVRRGQRSDAARRRREHKAHRVRAAGGRDAGRIGQSTDLHEHWPAPFIAVTRASGAAARISAEPTRAMR